MSSSPESGHRISSPVATILGSLLVAAVIAGASAVMRTERLDVRVSQLESERPSLLQVGKELGTLGEQMRSMNESMKEMKGDLKNVTTTSSVPRR